MLLALLVQACVGWPIGGDWVFRRGGLQETRTKTRVFQTQNWCVFISFVPCNHILAVTQIELNMSPLIILYNTILICTIYLIKASNDLIQESQAVHSFMFDLFLLKVLIEASDGGKHDTHFIIGLWVKLLEWKMLPQTFIITGYSFLLN